MKTLLLLLAASAQDPAPALPPGPSDDPARPWRTVDRIMVIVNQDVITESELRRGLEAMFARTHRPTSKSEQQSAEAQILIERVRQRLRVQAGANLGVDEKLIDARVRDSLEQLQKRQNGPVGLAKFFESKDISGPEVPEMLRDDIYDQIYREGVTGEAPGPLGRVTADRYVRPGSLVLLFDQAIQIPAEMENLGGHVGRVKFQQLVLDVEQSGGPEAARELAGKISERIRAGEDFGVLAREFGGVREGDGTTEVEEARLRDLFPEISAFTSAAQPGDLSAPIESTSRNKPILRLVRFVDRAAAQVPSFSDHEVQSKLRKRAEDRFEEYRLGTGYSELLRSSYVWPPELFNGRQS